MSYFLARTGVSSVLYLFGKIGTNFCISVNLYLIPILLELEKIIKKSWEIFYKIRESHLIRKCFLQHSIDICSMLFLIHKGCIFISVLSFLQWCFQSPNMTLLRRKLSSTLNKIRECRKAAWEEGKQATVFEQQMTI